jgi:5-methylcytosine-specific restriction endonuclease McrA
MNHIIWKHAPMRLERENYRQLRQQILNRDGWRCQFCGTMANLEVHHKAFRSQPVRRRYRAEPDYTLPGLPQRRTPTWNFRRLLINLRISDGIELRQWQITAGS